MLRASSLSPRSAFFTALSARLPSKSIKKRYEVAIPRSKLTITSGQILVNFSVTKRNSVDAICDVASTSTARWIPVTGLGFGEFNIE